MKSRAEWEARVAKELEGRSADSLAATLPEGFVVPALAPDDAVPSDTDAPLPGVWPYRRGAAAGAVRPRNMPRVEASGPSWTAECLDDLDGGADGVWIAGNGAGPAPEAAAEALRNAPADFVVGIDLGGDLARSEALAEALHRSAPAARPIVFVEPFAAGVPAEHSFAIPTHAWRSAGAHGVLEIAYAAATGVHSLRLLLDAEVDVAEAASRIGFSISLGRDVLVEIAKLRALRVVWAKVVAAAGVDAPPAWIHAASARDALARRGPLNNVLRGTTHAFAAICGGADAVTVLPFDALRGRPSREARRAARNTVTILAEECAVAAVQDPAGGAPAVEALTDRLARAAWERLRSIEAKGGMAACLLSGEIRRELDAARAARGAEPVIGETEFPDPDDADAPAATGARP
ncbi:MAG: methylmalonyl-CoA mutase family protein [bacterium]